MPIGKLMVGLFIFFICVMLWFWSINTWSALPVVLAIVYTIISLLFFDKLMTKKGMRR